MHAFKVFQSFERDEALALAESNPLATLVVNGTDGPLTALAPLVMNPQGNAFIGHIARVNPFWKTAVNAQSAVAIFRGAQAYISPSFYPSKLAHQKVVPTWNYLAVEIRGAIEIETDPSKMGPYIETLTAKMEANREGPWQISDAPTDYIARLSKGIVGLTLSIDDVIFVKKLSQDKPVEDQNGVVLNLEKSSNQSDRDLAREVNKERSK